MKIIDKLISGILCFCTIITNFAGIVSAETNEVAEDKIIYSQDFGEMPGVEPSGWNKSGYIEYNSIDNSLDIPNSVSGVALNATASGSGDRPAYVDISNDSMNQQECEVFEFDLYMNGGVNTCNIFTMSNKQENSYTDLSNTFFALGNGDGVGARNTLRYYNYNTKSWISIPDVNEMWLHVNVYVDFVEKKMAFELENGNGDSIGTYGVFYFGGHFLDKTPCFNRIVMSGFRTDGGVVSLNTWMDNFKISSIDEAYEDVLNYIGELPRGILGEDYSIIDMDGEKVLNLNESLNIFDLSDIPSNSELLHDINVDIKITNIPDSGYKTILSFNDDANGNLLINSKGLLVRQVKSSEYERILPTGKKMQVNKWYNIKAYVFLTTSTDNAYCTFVINGDFGEGYETIEYSSQTRNAESFKRMNLKIGNDLEQMQSIADVVYKNTFITLKERPNISVTYDNILGEVLVDGNVINTGVIYNNSIPKKLKIFAVEGKEIDKFEINGSNLVEKLKYDFINGGYVYNIPLQDENMNISVTYRDALPSDVIETKEDMPYTLDPFQSWDVRKYASEARTIQVRNAKMAYRLYLPVGYDSNEEKKYPLVLSLKADGEENTGFNNTPAGRVEEYLTRGENAINYPCFILSPQCYDESWTDNAWSNVGLALGITESIIAEFDDIDVNRVYIAGLSGGANAAWMSVALKPNLFAAASIMSGSALDVKYAALYANTPI